MNARLTSADGVHHVLVDPRARETILDFEEVVTRPGTNGEVDKLASMWRTHLLDGLGYFVVAEHPIDDSPTVTEEAFWG